jgi:2'-5' RNA ligase
VRRLFIAIDLPPKHRSSLSWMLKAAPPPGATLEWVKATKLHLTVRFLGRTTDDQMVGLMKALEGVQFQPFDLCLGPLGTFGPRNDPNILWAQVKPVKDLSDLVGAVDKAISGMNLKITASGGVFIPHITLARRKPKMPPVEEAHLRVPLYESEVKKLVAEEDWTVEVFHLYETVTDDRPGKSSVYALHRSYPATD